MMPIARGPQSQSALASALAWLDAPAIGDRLHDLSPLRHHLRAVVDAALDPLKKLMLLDPFRKRADAVNGSLKEPLKAATLPLTPRLRLIAQGLTDIHGLLATATLDAARKLTARQRAASGQRLADICFSVLHDLAEQQQVALMVAASPPADLWQHAQAAYSLLTTCPADETNAAERVLSAMLALAAAQPETFVGQETAFLINYLHSVPIGVAIDQQPKAPLDSWYWLDARQPQPPIAVARRPPPAGGKLLYFSCAALAQAADEHLRRLTAGDTPAALGLPPSLATEDCRIVLGRTQARWASPPRRRHHHRPSNYPVEICPELDQLWDLLREAGSTDAKPAPIPLTKWRVMNESPGGFAMTHMSGAISGLASGRALGLRTSPERPWNICLVRWTRSNDAEHVEVGLELIAPAAAPVQIVRRDSTSRSRLAPALLLRPGHGHHRHESLLTYRSGIASRPFTMITEPNGRVQLTECQVHRPALQTASVEVLEFMRDFSPSWDPS
jgi:cyclic-di-GMP-binding protein